MQKWEYKMLTIAYPYESHGIGIVKWIDGQEFQDWKKRKWWVIHALNELGKEGWELVHVVWRERGGDPVTKQERDPVYILKRPVP